MVNDLHNQVAQNKAMAEQLNQLETRNAEVTKKYEEYKKSYYKVRDEREKLKAEIANNNEQRPEQAPDLA